MAAKRKTQETLDDILAPLLERSGLSLTKWCEDNELNPRTIYRLRAGSGAHLGTLHMLATATGRSVSDLQKAIQASRKG